MQKAARAEDAAEHTYRGRAGRDIYPVAVFQHHFGQCIRSRLQLQNDAPGWLEQAKLLDQAAVGCAGVGQRRGFIAGARSARGRRDGDLGLKIAQRPLVVKLLRDAYALPCEFGRVQIGVFGDATDGAQGISQRAVGRQHVLARLRHFAFNAHAFVLLLGRPHQVGGIEGAQQVTVGQRHALAGRQVQLGQAVGRSVVQALQRQPPVVGHGIETTRHQQHVVNRLVGLDLKDGGTVDAADQRNLGADRSDMDHVIGLQQLVSASITSQQQVVQIEIGDQRTAATQLDAAVAARRRWPAGMHQRLRQRGQAAHRHGTRLVDESGHIHPQAAQLAQRDAELEVLEHHRHAAADDLGQIRIAHA